MKQPRWYFSMGFPWWEYFKRCTYHKKFSVWELSTLNVEPSKEYFSCVESAFTQIRLSNVIGRLVNISKCRSTRSTLRKDIGMRKMRGAAGYRFPRKSRFVSLSRKAIGLRNRFRASINFDSIAGLESSVFTMLSWCITQHFATTYIERLTCSLNNYRIASARAYEMSRAIVFPDQFSSMLITKR